MLQGTTYLVTRRCLGRRFLLRPDRALNELIGYCLARAAKAHGIELHAVTVMSNHYHLVLTDPRGVLPDFMRASGGDERQATSEVGRGGVEA